MQCGSHPHGREDCLRRSVAKKLIPYLGFSYKAPRQKGKHLALQCRKPIVELSSGFFSCRNNNYVRAGHLAKLGRAKSDEFLTGSRNERWAYAQEVIIAEEDEDNEI